MKRSAMLAQALMVCLLPLPLLGQDEAVVTGAKVTEAGIYSAQVITDQTNSAGIKLQGLDNFKLLSSTTNIPGRVGIQFGFRYEVLGAPTNALVILTMVTKHPPIQNSVTGKMETNSTYQLKSWIGKTYTACSLNETSDCVPGPWSFEVWYEEKKLCGQSFLVVPDEGSR